MLCAERRKIKSGEIAFFQRYKIEKNEKFILSLLVFILALLLYLFSYTIVILCIDFEYSK